MRRLVFLLLMALMAFNANTQVPFVHSNNNIYEFLDEIASLNIINLNAAVKPYSRKLIAIKLSEAQQYATVLNKRQQEELAFYMKEYQKELSDLVEKEHLLERIKTIKSKHERRADLFFYRDSLFTIWMNPIGGIQYFSNENGSFKHQWTGLEATAYIDENWSFYVSLRDNQVSTPIMDPGYLTQRNGEDNKGGDDFSDMRGGAAYQWKWGSIGFFKDQFVWGNAENGSNIFSGRIPTVPQVKLFISPVNWFEFNYIHVWMVSEVVDSTRIFDFGDGAKRSVFYPKYLAANMYTLTPFKHLNISLGNSIVYSNDRIQAGYLIPFILFKSIEHTIASSNENNAQVFFDISSRNIKNLHLYATWFIDEVNFGNMWNKDEHTNWFSYKAGLKLQNWPLQNVALTGEWTRTNPMVYKHYYPTSTFTSNLYNLGHYLGDNSQEFYVGLGYNPIHKLRLKLNYSYAEKGPDYPDVRSNPDISVRGKKFMVEREWTNSSFGVSASYELFHDAFLSFDYLYQDIWAKDQETMDAYTAPFYQGKTNTFSFRINFGF